MRICVFGGTGFVGSSLVQGILDEGHSITLLSRSGRSDVQGRDVSIVRGSITDMNAVNNAVSGSEAVIYAIGIIREVYGSGNLSFDEAHFTGVKNAVESAIRSGVKRFILISALGTKKSGTRYQETKYLGEKYLRESGLEWTTFSPSLIFGDPGNNMEFCTQVKQQIINLYLPAPLFFPGLSIFKAGRSLFTPVHISDVRKAVLESLDEPRSFGKNVTLCGEDIVSWKGLLENIAKAVGKRKIFVPVPAIALKPLCVLFEKFKWFPVSGGQLNMVTEGNAGQSNCSEAGLSEPEIRFTVDELKYLEKGN